MSAVLEQQPEQPPARPAQELPPAPTGSLLRAEAHRFRARRFIQVLLAVAVLGWIVITGISLTQFGTPTDAELSDARARQAEEIALNEQFRQDCLENPPPDAPDGLSPDELCGPPVTEENLPLDIYLDRVPFEFAEVGLDGAVGAAALSAVLAFVVGATWIGAEWSSRSIVALLFWEPRRGRVLGAKLAVLAVAAALLGLLVQLGWLAMAGILDAVAGGDAPFRDGFWPDLLQTQARGVLLTVVAALIGFGLTNLVRNTGAALGIGFVYILIVENVVRVFRPRWQPWLLTDNALALVQHGGSTLFFYDGVPDASGFVEPVEYYLGHLQAGLLLGGVVAVVVALGVVLFARRDIH